MIFSFRFYTLYSPLTSLFVDAQVFAPEPIPQEETEEADEYAGSFSPELFNADENEEAIDPEEDKAILVRLSSIFTDYIYYPDK